MSLLLRGCVELRGKTPSSRAQLDNYRKHCRQDRSPTKPGDGRLAEGNTWPVYRGGNAAGTTCLGDGILVEGHGLSHATKPQADRGPARGSTLAAQYFSTAITSKK
jgi:hypothetical protein